MKKNYLSLSGRLKPMSWSKIVRACKNHAGKICLIRHVHGSIIAGEVISIGVVEEFGKAVVIKEDGDREHPYPQKVIADIKFVPIDVWDRAMRLLNAEEGRIVAHVILNNKAMKGVKTCPYNMRV